ncbi:hypothetical protein F5Y19DRAFT_492534 [Xylariaceae sp. FL1651]|nr:hypothetical protein F5Y19DRAFT_492534 [Xylariaceae sp. FL1651]
MAVSLDGSMSSFPESNCYLPPAANLLIHDIIRSGAEAHPDAEAICAWDCTFSYGVLDSLSSRLASYIVSRGVGPEIVVPLVFEKSGWAVVSMLAVMKAGGAFMPLDICQPESRLRSVIKQSSARFVLSSATCYEFCLSLTKNTFAVTELTVMALDTSILKQSVSLNNAAYVMSTSGSTGVPKLVVTEHLQLASFVAYLTQPLGFTETTRTLQFASYVFDPIIGDIFLTLAAGGTVCIPSEDERKNDLVGAMRRMRVSLAKFTPSLLGSLAGLTPASVPTLRTLVLGGETTLPTIIEAWAGSVDLKLIYGCTECTISCVIADASTRVVVPGEIGYPIGSQAWVVNPGDVNKLVDNGEVGELVLGGPLVSRGYSDNPSETDSRYINSPTWFSTTQSSLPNGCRLYRTGDLVRRAENGTLVYVGRLDNQIKIRGQRLELEEVEQHLRQVLTDLPGIKVNGVLVDATMPLGAVAKRLIAFLCLESKFSMGSLLLHHERSATVNLSPTTQNEFTELVTELESRMKSKVPAYMVPSLWIPIDEIPYTLSRKRDRQRLRKAVQSLPTNWLTSFTHTGPSLFPAGGSDTRTMTSKEMVLQRLLSNVLNLEVQSIRLVDNFFQLGGDSLLALRLISVARQEDHQLTVEDIFGSATLQDLATKLTPMTKSTTLAPFALLDTDKRLAIQQDAIRQCGVALDHIEDIYPLYPMQMHYITGYPELGRDIIGPWDWQQQIVFLLPGGFDIPRFKSSWKVAIERHSQLRTRVIQTDHGIFQVAMRQQFAPSWRDVEDLQEYIGYDRAALMSFGDELLRLAIATSGQKRYFVLTMQHLIYDAYSRGVLFSELEAAFLQKNNSINGLLPSPPLQMNQFIKYVKESDRKSAIDFWTSYLAGAATRPLLKVPIGSTPVNELCFYKTTQNKPAPLPFWKCTTATILEVSSGLAIAQRLDCVDVIFYSDRAGRNLPVGGIQDLVAPTTLFLPTRVHVDRGQRIHDLLYAHQAGSKTMLPYETLDWSEMREMEHLKSILAHSVNLNINPATQRSNLGEAMGLRVVDEHETRDDPFSIIVTVGEDVIEWEFYYDEGFITHGVVNDLAMDLMESFRVVWEACKSEQMTVGNVIGIISRSTKN